MSGLFGGGSSSRDREPRFKPLKDQTQYFFDGPTLAGTAPLPVANPARVAQATSDSPLMANEVEAGTGRVSVPTPRANPRRMSPSIYEEETDVFGARGITGRGTLLGDFPMGGNRFG